MWNQLPSLKEIADKVQRDGRNRVSEYTVPSGYASIMDCLNQPQSWDVPGMIADMAENLRRGNDVPHGQLLAAIDWLTFRLKEARTILVAADSECSAVAHGRAVDNQEAARISDESRALCGKLKGF